MTDTYSEYFKHETTGFLTWFESLNFGFGLFIDKKEKYVFLKYRILNR